MVKNSTIEFCVLTHTSVKVRLSNSIMVDSGTNFAWTIGHVASQLDGKMRSKAGKKGMQQPIQAKVAAARGI